MSSEESKPTGLNILGSWVLLSKTASFRYPRIGIVLGKGKLPKHSKILFREGKVISISHDKLILLRFPNIIELPMFRYSSRALREMNFLSE